MFECYDCSDTLLIADEIWKVVAERLLVLISYGPILLSADEDIADCSKPPTADRTPNFFNTSPSL